MPASIRLPRCTRDELHTLKDGSSLMLFHERECGEDYLTHAICCGELMRALGHALQIEVADSGITLQLQLGLTLGSDLEELGQAELLLSDSALDALALSQHSRNLLLVEQRVAQDALARQRARIRPIASPEGASCVERLLDPYPALLERQLTRMARQPGTLRPGVTQALANAAPLWRFHTVTLQPVRPAHPLVTYQPALLFGEALRQPQAAGTGRPQLAFAQGEQLASWARRRSASR